MPFNSKASPGWLRKNPRTEAFASAGAWLTAAVSTLLASGWPSRYPLAAFRTPLAVAATPLAEHGSGAAPAVGATMTQRSQTGINPNTVRHNDLLIAWSLRGQLFECSVHQLPKNTNKPCPEGTRGNGRRTRKSSAGYPGGGWGRCGRAPGTKKPGPTREPGFFVDLLEGLLRSPYRPCHRSGRPPGRPPSPACRQRRPRSSGTAPRWTPRSAAPNGSP